LRAPALQSKEENLKNFSVSGQEAKTSLELHHTRNYVMPAQAGIQNSLISMDSP
jgi:hypothetical protein